MQDVEILGILESRSEGLTIPGGSWMDHYGMFLAESVELGRLLSSFSMGWYYEKDNLDTGCFAVCRQRDA